MNNKTGGFLIKCFGNFKIFEEGRFCRNLQYALEILNCPLVRIY